VSANAAVVKDAQLANAEAPIEVTPAGIAMDSRPDPIKAEAPIDVSELGSSIVFKARQPKKALAGILVVLAGIVTSPFASGVIRQAHVGFGPE
jgi:hypothetical protein